MSIIYGGLDVHKRSISVCLLDPHTGEIVHDEVANERERFLRAAKRWRTRGDLRFCYEASGAGFVVKRWLDEIGVFCEVIAPSLVPKAPGDRVKTDRRDARKLATLYRAGLLQPVRVPGQEEETVRALVRLRQQVSADTTRTKNRLLKYLRTLGHTYGAGHNWTQKHREWIARLALDATQRLIVQSHLDALDSLVYRRRGIERAIEEIALAEPYREQVQRLMSLRGIGLFSAMVLLTEIGDARRFAEPTQLMAYLGLVPRESSSGESRWTGSITKSGNHYARWILTEAGWNQMARPGHCVRVRRHWQSQPTAVVEIAKKAERRLHDKFWRVASRKDRKTAVVAVAREMAGFIWALLTLKVA